MKSKYLVIISFILLLSQYILAEELYFPPTLSSQWETVSLEELGWDSNKIDSLLSLLERNSTKAFIVLKNGKIAIEKYFGGFTKDSVWYWASAGKSLVATLIGIAQQEAYLSIEDKVSKYLGNDWTICPIEKEQLITIRHQLTMTTGLDDKVIDNHCTDDTCLKYLADAGTRWAYHNAPYTLLEKVLSSATNTNINQYVTNKFLMQTGITGLFLKIGYNNIFFSTPRSMARFGLLMLNKGYWKDIPILSDSNYYGEMINSSQSLNESYGYLWWLNGKNSFMLPGMQIKFNGMLTQDAPADMFSALGKNGQILSIIPSQNLVVVRMGNAPDDSGAIGLTLNNEMWKILKDIIGETVSVGGFDSKSINIHQDSFTGDIIIESLYSEFDLSIYDILGKNVYNKNNLIERIKINRSDFQLGLYFLTIKIDNHKFIRNKIVFY